MLRTAPLRWAGVAAALSVSACGLDDASPTSFSSVDGAACSIPEDELFNGGPGKDGIPALTNPTLVAPTDQGAAYLLPDDRVIGFGFGDEVVAIPLNIMWWHEIVNIEVGGRVLAVTHCPLTGSTLAFDRGELANVEFGVSGLLFRNNLVMYDRSAEESLWPQMSRGARCGERLGTDLTMFPVVEATWEWWSTNNPQTRVVSSDTGHSRDYQRYPYGAYDLLNNDQTLFPIEIDPRRPPKERVLGIPEDGLGVAYPFGELALLGDVAVVDALEGIGIGPPDGTVIFWDAEAQAAMAYSPIADGTTELTFGVAGGEIVDDQTGSVWRVDGVAESGPMQGSRLAAVAEAYVAYWFAWAAFEPTTTIWSAP